MKKVLVLEDEANIRGFVVINSEPGGLRDHRGGHRGGGAGAAHGATRTSGWPCWTSCCLTWTGLRSAAGSGRATPRLASSCSPPAPRRWTRSPGLMTGADDYVTKPFSPAELTARIDALYRRIGGDADATTGEISQPPFLLNTRNRTLGEERPADQADPGGVFHHEAVHGKPGQGPLPGGDSPTASGARTTWAR